MPPTAVTKTDALTVSAHVGDAKTLLAWNLPQERSENLAGFSIECQPPGKPSAFLPNRLRFEHPEQHAQVAAEPPNSSANAPFHKFRWLHVPDTDDQGAAPAMGSYTYAVTPRYFDGKGALLPLDPDLRVAVDVEVAGFAKGSMELAFTRGYVQSQAYVERFGPEAIIKPKGSDLQFDTSQVAGKSPNGTEFTYAEEYEWLGFTARSKVFSIVHEVLADPGLKLDVFAYDLNEPDFVTALIELAKQGRARVILDDAALHHSSSDPEPEDKFTALFTAAATAPAEVKRGHFSRYSHDKILIVSDASGPTKVLSGSTNFSVTGLYVNSNHVVVFNDPETTAEYGKLFQQVWDDDVATAPFVGSPLSTQGFTASAGVTPPRSVTFAPHDETTTATILDAIAARIAQEAAAGPGIGNVMFAVMQLDAGTSPVYTALNSLHADQSIFSYGISDDPEGISLYKPGTKEGVMVTGKPIDTKLPPPFNQVPKIGLGHQIHHKFVICGFNGDAPVVFCGSSNLASGGEQANGDNLIEIHDPDVVSAFALEAIALVDHFEFLDGMSSSTGAPAPAPPPASKTEGAVSAGWFLSTSDRWVKPYFDPGDLHCIDRRLFSGSPV